MRRTLFIHVPRTAGSSIDSVARRVCTYQNLGSRIHPKFDPLREFTSLNHVPAGSLIDRNIITREWYDGCFKFAFVRNPWDRLVSLFCHLQYRVMQSRKHESNAFLSSGFTSFIKAVRVGAFVRPLGKRNVDDWSQANSQTEWLKWGMDFIGGYERLDADWKRVCEMAGMKHVELPRKRKSKHRTNYRDYYDNMTRILVAERYAEEIELFNYKF